MQLTTQLQAARSAVPDAVRKANELTGQLAQFEATYAKLQEQLAEMSARFTEEHAKCATLMGQVEERKASAAREKERLEAQLDGRTRELDAVKQELLEVRANGGRQAEMALKAAEDTRAENAGLKGEVWSWLIYSRGAYMSCISIQ
jgi:chromosome segregation ATPase